VLIIRLVGLEFNSIFSTNRIYHAVWVRNILRMAGDKHTIKTILKTQKHTEVLFDLVFVPKIISSTHIGILRGVFLANQLASTDN